MSPNWEQEGPSHWLIAAWQEGFRRVLEAMAPPEAIAGLEIKAVSAHPEAWSDWNSPQWYQQALVGVPGATVFLGWPAATMQAVGRLIAGNPNATEGECQDAFLEVISRIASPTGDAISARLERRVSFSPAQVTGPPAEQDYAIDIRIVHQGTVNPLALAPNPHLMDAVSPPSAARPPASQPQAAESPAAFPSGIAPGNLDLLLEVELPVCVTFGRTQLLLKDVLKLSSGSIVELNRLANEPVEVMINNYVIARGEVVVVEGNYGVRVTEIVSRQERIRTLL